MLVSISVLGGLVLLITGIAVWGIWMDKKKRLDVNGIVRDSSQRPVIPSTTPPSRASLSSTIDIDLLADKIGKATARELRDVLSELLANLPVASTDAQSFVGTPTRRYPQIDESVIPITLDLSNFEEPTNLDKATKEEQVDDASMKQSKSKLAQFLSSKRSQSTK